jgi:hypothetical protein
VQPICGTTNYEGRLEITGEGINPEEIAGEKPGCDFREHP